MPATPDKMFGEDPFSEIFNQLAGGREHSSGSTRTQAQSLLNTIESKKQTILIFDLSGKKIDSVEIEDDIETNEYGERVHNGQKVLVIGLESDETLKYVLPRSIAKRKVSHTFSNGILEVSLIK